MALPLLFQAVTFYWWYVHVASASPLAHHYRTVLGWGP